MITRWGLLTEVGWTIGDGAANVVGDPHGQVEPVDETDVVPIESSGVAQCPFSHRCRGHTRARAGVTFQSAVAACSTRARGVSGRYSRGQEDVLSHLQSGRSWDLGSGRNCSRGVPRCAPSASCPAH